MSSGKERVFIWVMALGLAAAADVLLLGSLCFKWFRGGELPLRGRYDDAVQSAIQEEIEEKKAEEKSRLSGSGWESADGVWYFTADGAFYFIGKKTENYIRGAAGIRELDATELPGTGGELVLDAVSAPRYFKAEIRVDQELYFGNLHQGGSYTIYAAINDKEGCIYDSGWGEAKQAKRVTVPVQAVLDDHFRLEEYAEARPWGAAGDPTVFCREEVDFSASANTREQWNVIQLGGNMVIKRGDGSHNALYIRPLDGSGSEELLYEPPAGSTVGVFGAFGKDLLYVLNTPGGQSELYRMDPVNRMSSLLVQDNVQDFCVSDGVIYYTDYQRLVRLVPGGVRRTLWEGVVYGYEVDGGRVYLYDGDSWELLDAESGEDLGYIRSGDAYARECDMVRYSEEYLYYVVYDYDRESISLRAMNVWTGEERIVADEYEGKKGDTYNVLFTGTYCYFTAEDGERLVRVDVKSGTAESRTLREAGYWYATELVLLGDRVVLHAYDNEEKVIYLEVGDELQMVSFLAEPEPSEE
ncbi:MAG: DUF5050 domain-containing protein [Lachnospiraceae bacterium]|nr:DUF5050 domain-containing protein [Lachnospiraceae bacterium]